jgi:alkylation response protein AidB-like acyl-CoA dehydrogenase
MSSTAGISRLASAETPLARARAVAPIIAAAAQQIEAKRELSPDVLAAMHDARLFRMLLPPSLGGETLDPVRFAQVTEVIAAADGSTAWCLGQGTVSNMAAAYLDPGVARRLFGPRDAVLAWGAGAAGRAHVVPGGYRVTGKWSFASGSRHATTIGGHSLVFEANGEPRRRADGRILDRSMLFRRDQVTVIDDWQVMGLRGTGSDSYSVTDLFVPDELTIDRENDDERREPATIYRFPFTQVYAAGFAGVALGVARGALDALHELAAEKTQRGASTSMRDSPVFASQLAEFEAQHRAARMYLHGSYGEVWQAVESSGVLTLDQRVALRLCSTWTINQATDLTTAIYRAAGSTAVFERHPFERRLRDALAVSQQAQGRTTHYQIVGRHMLGHAIDTSLFL